MRPLLYPHSPEQSVVAETDGSGVGACLTWWFDAERVCVCGRVCGNGSAALSGLESSKLTETPRRGRAGGRVVYFSALSNCVSRTGQRIQNKETRQKSSNAG